MPGRTVQGPGEVRCRQCGQYVLWMNGYLAPHDVRPGMPCTGSNAVAAPPPNRVEANAQDAPTDLLTKELGTLNEEAVPYGGTPPKPGVVYGDRFEKERRQVSASAVAASSLAEHVAAHAPQEAPASEPTKQRPGDQPLPIGDETRPDVQSMVIADIEGRRRVGIERYGQALRTFNGRHTLLDAYEEAVDLTIYLRSLLAMQQATREQLAEVVAGALLKKIGPYFAEETRERFCNEVADDIIASIIDTFSEHSPE